MAQAEVGHFRINVHRHRMYLSVTFIFASLSFLVEATPLLSRSRSGFAIPISRRSRIRDANGVVDFTRLQRSVDHSITKLHDGFQAYQRNTGFRHASAPTAKRLETSIGSVPLVFSEWYGNVSVGTPAQTFTVSFDTAVSDFFLPSAACDSSCEGHTLYDVTESSSSFSLGTQVSLKFGGSISQVDGVLYTDNVTIGGYTAQKLTFLAATTYSNDFKYPGWHSDGLLGLGFPNLSQYHATPLFNTLVAEDVLPSNSFGICASELYIGGTNCELYKGDFTYVPITGKDLWEITFTALYFNRLQISLTTKIVVDIGSTMITGDSKTVQALYDQISGSVSIGSGYYTVPCSSKYEISFQFGTTNFTLRPEAFNFGTNLFSNCIGGIVADDSLGFWVLGDVFLQNVYTEFDVENMQIGFATLA